MKKYVTPFITMIEIGEVDELLSMSDIDIMPGAGDVSSPDMGDCKSSVWDDEEKLGRGVCYGIN